MSRHWALFNWILVAFVSCVSCVIVCAVTYRMRSYEIQPTSEDADEHAPQAIPKAQDELQQIAFRCVEDARHQDAKIDSLLVQLQRASDASAEMREKYLALVRAQMFLHCKTWYPSEQRRQKRRPSDGETRMHCEEYIQSVGETWIETFGENFRRSAFETEHGMTPQRGQQHD